MKTYFWLTMDDGVDVYVRCWQNNDYKPRGVVQIVHGMAEHVERYNDFAEFLVANGFIVYGNDHRGHGRTGEKAGVFGYFADYNGFDRVVSDVHQVTQYIKKHYPNSPLFILGHSLGSFITRRYIQIYSTEISGVILSGTAGNPGVAAKLGKALARWEIKKYGQKEPSHLLNKLIFGSYNKGFENVKNKFPWLSRDEKVVEDFVQDPLCGFVCSTRFFYDLLTGLQLIHKNEYIQQIRKDLPMMFISGDKDPVGAYAKGVEQAIKQYKENGLTNIESIIYEDGRHEMLNEINKEDVYRDLLLWLNRWSKNKK